MSARSAFALSLAAALLACATGPVTAAEPKGKTVSGNEVVITNRVVEIAGGIAFENMKAAQKQLLDFDAQGHDPIWIRINSPGGSVDAGLILIDTMKSIESPINCVVESSAYSMAAILLTFCDKRYGLPHATYMLHEASYGTAGEDPQNRSKLDFLTKYLDRLHEEIAKNIKMDLKKYRARIRDAWWMLSDEAKSIGLIDEIITNVSYEEVVVERTEEKKTVSYTDDTEQTKPDAPKIPKRRD
ncbi:MAG: ATP-dependent Clp protease proteolytic subunit [Myxococcota bacterium]